MLVFRFGPTDLANVRFAISPMVELHQSLRSLSEPDMAALHLPWINTTLTQVPREHVALLRALQPRGAYSPDFLHPTPTSPLAEFDDDLAKVKKTSPEQVRFEVERAYRRRRLPAILRPFVDDPKTALVQLADVVLSYWDTALAPHWPRLRALLEGDILYRARRLADGGAQLVFEDVHPEARFADNALWIEKPFDEHVELGGRGLLFLPSAFSWPRVGAITQPPWQPTLIYPARGVAMLWDTERPAAPEALAAVIGDRRATVLATLDAPQSTTELATRLDVSAPSVSQHLAVLRDAGLVQAHRVGRVVLYARSATGDALVGA